VGHADATYQISFSGKQYRVLLTDIVDIDQILPDMSIDEER
jgi:hypothetical protein